MVCVKHLIFDKAILISLIYHQTPRKELNLEFKSDSIDIRQRALSTRSKYYRIASETTVVAFPSDEKTQIDA